MSVLVIFCSVFEIASRGQTDIIMLYYVFFQIVPILILLSTCDIAHEFPIRQLLYRFSITRRMISTVVLCVLLYLYVSFNVAA